MSSPPARVSVSILRWLLASSVVNNLGDGIWLAAGPLRVAAQTCDPLLVSIALLSQQLPNLLFGIPAGAIADRLDRRRIIAGVIRPVLVRVHRLGAARGAPVAPVRPYRPRQRGVTWVSGSQGSA
jgi:MFS family permease